MESLCKTCVHVREIVSGTGSTFLLCRLSQMDNRFPKYPPQPIIRCDGFDEGLTRKEEVDPEQLP